MSHPLQFEVRGLTFTFQRGKIFLEDQEISFRDLFLFARGKIDLAPKPTIVDVVLDVSGATGLDSDGGDFDILREALIAADLVDTLADRDADFSVFAPTDAAFIQLAQDLGAGIEDDDEQGALDAILTTLASLDPEGDPVPLLKQILLYHVSPDGRTLAELQADGTITTAQGDSFDVRGVDLVDGEPDVANPKVVSPDIDTANGTIQVIDRVLLPFDLDGNDRPNIVEIAAGSDDFNILVMALSAAGLVETVEGLEDITVFAPTDAAFTQLALDLGLDPDTTGDDAVFEFIAGALAGLDPDGNPIPLLTDILLYHVSVGAKSAAALENLGTVETVFGTSFGVDGTELIDGEPDIENPNIVIPDILGGNGTIQAIDRVLIPIDIPGNETGETIEGTNGRDHLVGTSGDDEIFGLKGKDKLFGGDGDDALFGGAGRDLLAGGAGDDHLSGGWGRDYFDFRDLDGNDTVKDLSSRDKVIISTDDFSNRHELFAAIQQDGDDAVIQTEQGSITLEDVEVAHLNPHIFIFA